MKIKADTSELHDLQVDLEKMPQKVRRAVHLEIENSARAIEAEIKRLGKVHFDTGAFDASVSADTEDGWKTAEIGSDVLHSIFLEVGTKAHLIPETPRPSKPFKNWLHFFWPPIGKYAHARQVEHKGTPAFNLHLKAFIKVMEPFDQTFGKRLIEWLKKIK